MASTRFSVKVCSFNAAWSGHTKPSGTDEKASFKQRRRRRCRRQEQGQRQEEKIIVERYSERAKESKTKTEKETVCGDFWQEPTAVVVSQLRDDETRRDETSAIDVMMKGKDFGRSLAWLTVDQRALLIGCQRWWRPSKEVVVRKKQLVFHLLPSNSCSFFFLLSSFFLFLFDLLLFF